MKKQFTRYYAFGLFKLKLPGKWVTVAFIIFCSSLNINNLAAQPTKEWDKTIGGNREDRLHLMQPTTDGGYILGGSSESAAGFDKSQNAKGSYDYWVVKVNAAGVKEWDKTYGGTDYEELTALQQTVDGGYILGGSSASGAGADRTESSRGSYDYWIVKLNATGEKQWDKAIGGEFFDAMLSMQQTTDKGYILGGWSNSAASGEKSQMPKGGVDYWIVKLNEAGEKQWDKTIGGSTSDYLSLVQQTTDDGYILAGQSESEAGLDKSESSKGALDLWIVKLNAAGEKQWDKSYGGLNFDYLSALKQTTEGGYLLGSTSFSGASGDKSEPSRGGYDFWVVKINATGGKEWDKAFGGTNDDYLEVVQSANGDGYILGGRSVSTTSADRTEPTRGAFDFWLVKITSSGTKEWDKAIGGNNDDYLESIVPTTDGGYMLGGTSDSGFGAEKTENRKGNADYWLVKLKGTTPPPDGICNIALTTQINQAEPWYGMWGIFAGAGAIDLTVTGGTGPYTYRWNAGLSSQDIPAASPGQYSVTVTDANGCTATTSVYVGVKNDFLRVISSHKNVSTAGGADGAIDLSVIGGVVPATFAWNNGATYEDLTGLTAGTYKVIVTDAFGRQATTTIIISEPDTPLSLMATHQNVSAVGKKDGAIDLTVIGGVGPYTYRWNTGARTEDLAYAPPGDYMVTVTDAEGNTATTTVRVEVGRAPIVMARKPNTAADLLTPTTSLSAYPNPASSQASIRFSLPEAGNYTLELYDIRGAKVKTFVSGKSEAQEAVELTVDVADYAKGIYLLKLITDKKTASKRLLIQR